MFGIDDAGQTLLAVAIVQGLAASQGAWDGTVTCCLIRTTPKVEVCKLLLTRGSDSLHMLFYMLFCVCGGVFVFWVA